jgi:hypothetical protein
MRAVVLALLAPALCLVQLQAQPRLAVDDPIHDFGRLAADAVVSHRFRLRNAGNAPLAISKVNVSCGCTTTAVGKETLAPGEETTLEATFHASGDQGPVRKVMQVLSNDPASPSFTLTFVANVQSEVLVPSDQLWFQDLMPGDRRRDSLQLKTGTGQPIALANVELSDAPWLGVVTREVGKDLWVDFDLLASRLPQDRLSGTDTVVVHVANPRPSIVRLSIHWEKRSPVALTPERVAWDQPAGAELQASVLLWRRNNKPFLILSARTSSPLLTVASLPTQANARQKVQLKLSAAAPRGTYLERAYLTLDMPGHPQVEIPVAVNLR